MQTARTVFASLVFTVAVIALINFLGNVLVGGGEMAQNTKTTPPEAQPEATPEAKPEAKPTVASVLVVDEESAKMGSGIFRKKCLGCHPIVKGGPNRTGPNLFAIVGREKGVREGYRYSAALKREGGTWTEDDLNNFIAGPRAMVPNTKMTFAGIKKKGQRMDIIAYLRTLNN